MAQADIKPASLFTGNKIRIKLKGRNPKKGTQAPGPSNGAEQKQQWSLDSLADLHAAVEAFCQQGVRSLPGAVPLSPWDEVTYDTIAFQQVLALQSEPAAIPQQIPQEQQPQQQTAKRRVRKRRAPDAEQLAGVAADQQQQLGWGGTKRRRSVHHRAARDVAQLSNSIHDMLQLPSAPGSPSIVSHPAAAAVSAVAAPAGQLPPTLVRSNSATDNSAATAKQQSRLQKTLQQDPAARAKPGQKPAAAAIQAAVAPASATPAAVPEAAVPMDTDAPPAMPAAVRQAPERKGLAPAPAGQLEPPLNQQQVHHERPALQTSPQEVLPVQASHVEEPKQLPDLHPQQPQLVTVKQKQPADTSQQQQPPEQRQQRDKQQAIDRVHIRQPKQPAVQPKKQRAGGGQTQQLQQSAVDPASLQQRQRSGDVVQQQQTRQAPLQREQVLSQQRQSAESRDKQKQTPVPGHQSAPPEQQQQQPPVQEPQQALRQQVKLEPAVQQPPVDAAQPAPAAAEAPAVADQVLKPSSPPSETSHQQRIAPQHMQQLLPKAELLQPEQQIQLQGSVGPAGDVMQSAQQQQQQPVEQTAVSRDRSQCSLQRADAARGTAAVNMPAPAALSAAQSAAAAAAGPAAPSGRLLELAAGSMTPAAHALAALSSVPEVKQRCLPPEGVGRTQEEAMQYLARMMEKAKQLKHQGDKRQRSVGSWDVFGLSFYALSTVEFLLYWDTAQRFLDKLGAAHQPLDRLQQQVNNLSNAQFLRQTGALSTTGMNHCSNCKGPDVAKQALRMLLERLSAISNMRNLHNQRKQLEGHIRLLKSNGSSIGSSSGGGAVRLQQQHQAQQGRLQMQAQRAAAAAAVGKPPSPNGGSWSPAGQQAFNKRSPDDSNASNQERVQLPVGADQVAAAAGAGGAPAAAAGHAAGVQAERALHLAKSERLLMDSMQELLRMTDGMNQTVMRMQQFLESPEVLSNEHARAAALHISVLGLDAGMFSIPRVAAHTEAAVMCITKLLRSS